MGIAWNQCILVFIAFLYQQVKKRLHVIFDIDDGGSKEKLDVHRYLIISAPASVDHFPNITDAFGEHELYLRVDILCAFINGELACFNIGQDFLEFGYRQVSLFLAHQPLFTQHGHVGNRTFHIKARHLQIKITVSSNGESLNLCCCGCFVFAPKFHGNVLGYISKRKWLLQAIEYNR